MPIRVLVGKGGCTVSDLRVDKGRELRLHIAAFQYDESAPELRYLTLFLNCKKSEIGTFLKRIGSLAVVEVSANHDFLTSRLITSVFSLDSDSPALRAISRLLPDITVIEHPRLGPMSYVHELNWFETSAYIGDKRIPIVIDELIDAPSNSYGFTTCEHLLKNFPLYQASAISAAQREVLALYNDSWRKKSREPMSWPEFSAHLSVNGVEINGQNVELELDAGDLFLGHVLVAFGNVGIEFGKVHLEG